MQAAPVIDLGPRERFQHGRLIVEGKQGEALDERGDRVIRARETREWVVDALHESGALGDGDVADRRYDAALWLCQCHHKAGLTPRGSMRYDAGTGGKGEMEEAVAWNRKVYNEAMREMGRYAWIVEIVVIDGHPLTMVEGFCRGLDALAKHRGIG